MVLDGEESESVPVTSGVTQGSVLSPILVLVLFINDLLSELSSQVHLFVDDKAMYLTVGGAEDRCYKMTGTEYPWGRPGGT